jgi:hypothetical protein
MMQFSTLFRLELFRLGLGGLARAVAFDSEPTAADRSRGEHLRNGVGALLFVSSEVGLHRNLIASGWGLIASGRRAGGDSARSELRYGLSELRKAEPLAAGRQFASRHRLGLLLVTTAGVGLAGSSLGRMR